MARHRARLDRPLDEGGSEVAPSALLRAGTWRHALSGAAAVLFCGCSEPAALPRLELADFAASARLVSETRAIDIGTAAGRALLDSGWGPDEKSGETTFAWGAGPASTLRFDVVEPRDLRLELRGWAFPFAMDLPVPATAVVSAWLDGEKLGEGVVGPELSSLRFDIPAARLSAGTNVLQLRYSRWNEEAGGAPWAVAWDGIRVAAGEPPAPPRIDRATGVELPVGSAVEWALELPAESWLAWDDVDTEGDARLEVDVQLESSGAAGKTFRGELVRAGRVAVTGPAADPAASRAEMPSELTGIRLRAVGSKGSVALRGARIESRSFPVSAPSLATPEPAKEASGARPNLIVYLIDTLRADHLGCYGYPLPTSPRIDAFAREGVLFREARAQSSWTKPAVATFLTGLYPVSHGADRRARGIADGVVTLAERLAKAGYDTAFFTTNPTVTDRFGFHRGFEEFRYLSLPRGRRRGHVDAAEINREVVDWLDRRKATRPFFLVVHTLDPHDPYEPREPYRSRFAGAVSEKAARSACCIRAKELGKLDAEASRARARDSIALYDAEIAQNDAAFGELLDELSRRALYDGSAIVLTSDHGEEFFEHGNWRHANSLYEEVLRIPFVLRLPGGERAGLALDAPLDQVDLAPTLLALAGAPVPPELPGGSWLPALGGGPAPDRESLAWLEHPAFSSASIRLGGWKAIRTLGAWRPPVGRAPDEIYDLGADPGELRDLAAAQPLRRRWVLGRMSAAGSRLPRAGGADVEIDAELDRTLRALGYL